MEFSEIASGTSKNYYAQGGKTQVETFQVPSFQKKKLPFWDMWSLEMAYQQIQLRSKVLKIGQP